jgi:16S rRNA (cytosine1402-N4)-methyltransferase
MPTMTKKREAASVRGRHHLSREEGGSVREQKQLHVSVMVAEVLEALALKKGDVVIDATYGQGGHSRAIKAVAGVQLISIDADPASGADITGNFGDLQKLLKKVELKKADKMLFDLGWNRDQLGAGKGLSFMSDDPLNMSYGLEPRSGFTAAEILNTFSEKALADILYGYGEERYARRIARAIVARRDFQSFTTARELVELVRDAVPAAYRRSKTHFATRTFQALRIAVNDELKVLEDGLRAAWNILTPGGRIVVITFHSIEDRIVKNLFKEFSRHDGSLLYKKPLAPSVAETSANPAARSAKMRAIQKICKA